MPSAEISSMSIYQSVECPLTVKDTAVIAGTLSTQNGTGTGAFMASWRRLTSDKGWAEVCLFFHPHKVANTFTITWIGLLLMCWIWTLKCFMGMYFSTDDDSLNYSIDSSNWYRKVCESFLRSNLQIIHTVDICRFDKTQIGFLWNSIIDICNVVLYSLYWSIESLLKVVTPTNFGHFARSFLGCSWFQPN